jgi:hypothetical protein
MQLNEKYILDQKGNKESVILPYKQYLQLLEIIEDNEDIKDYVKFIKKDEDLVSYEDALKELDL